VILTEAPSGGDCNCKEGREMRVLAHKRNPFLLQEKSFPPLRKKSSLFSREIDFSQRGNLKKARDEVRPTPATISSVKPSSLQQT